MLVAFQSGGIVMIEQAVPGQHRNRTYPFDMVGVLLHKHYGRIVALRMAAVRGRSVGKGWWGVRS